MYKVLVAVLVLWTCLTHNAPLYAQPQPLESGALVRVSAQRCGLVESTTVFEAQRNDSLILESARCPLADITGLEVHRGKRRNWLLGAGVGLLAGAATGAALFASSGGVESCTGA